MRWIEYKEKLDKEREQEKERSAVYKFSVRDAEKYGTNEAIILYNFRFWLRKNLKDNRNVYDGRVWTFNSFTKLENLFTFLTRSQIRTAISHLLDDNIIVIGNYNKRKGDKTHWYSVNEVDFIIGDTCATSEYKWRVVKTPKHMLKILENSDGKKCKPCETLCDASHNPVSRITQPCVTGNTKGVSRITQPCVTGNTTLPVSNLPVSNPKPISKLKNENLPNSNSTKHSEIESEYDIETLTKLSEQEKLELYFSDEISKETFDKIILN